jgi:DNA-binding transcriptional regulator of glucitol operon
MNKRAKVAIAILIVWCLCLATASLQTYKRYGTVIESNSQEVVIEDCLGFVWEARASGFDEGDEVVMVMKDKGTSSITDDEIKELIKREE